MSDRCTARIPRVLAGALFGAWLLACGCTRNDPLVAIRAQQSAGDFAGSIAPLDALLVERPEETELHYLRGLALLRTGQPSLAAWSLRKAMEDPAWLSKAGLQLAAGSLMTGNAEIAIAATSRILEAQPDNVSALALRAEAKAASRRDDLGALADAERALELDPDEQGALVTRAVSLLSLERVEEAEKALQQLEERVREADLGSDAGARFCLVRATFLREKGDAQASQQAFESCLERYPRNPRVVSVVVEGHDREGRTERSIEILRAALAAEPQASAFRVDLAMRLERAGQHDEALRLLQEGTQEQDPQLASVAWVDLANLQISRGELDAAAASLAKAIELSPEPRPELLFQHAETLLMAGRHAEAREAAAQLEVPAHRELIEARVLLDEGKPKEALARFEAGLALWPDNAIARYFAARSAEQLGDFDRAILEYRYAIRAGIDQTDARYRLARLHEAEHAYDRAIVVARHASASVPTDPAAERVALRILGRLGRLPEAREVIAQRAQQPEIWGVTVAAMAEGVAQGRGPAQAAKLIRETEGLDLREPRNQDALRVLVQVSCAAGDAAGARTATDAAIAAHADVAGFHALRGEALACGDAPNGEVRAAYERALALDANQVRALAGLARLAADAGDTEGALQLYARLGSADREELADPAPRRAWAELLVRLGREPEAEAQLEELLRLDPYDAPAASRLAELRGGDAALTQRAARFSAPKQAPPA